MDVCISVLATLVETPLLENACLKGVPEWPLLGILEKHVTGLNAVFWPGEERCHTLASECETLIDFIMFVMLGSECSKGLKISENAR